MCPQTNNMKKAIVINLTSGTPTESVMHVISEESHFEAYQDKFPLKFKFVKKYFIELLNEGETILVNQHGGWCIVISEMYIKEYLTN